MELQSGERFFTSSGVTLWRDLKNWTPFEHTIQECYRHFLLRNIISYLNNKNSGVCLEKFIWNHLNEHTYFSTGTPECDSQYCVPPSLTSTYSYDYSYDYPLYIQSPHSMVPSSYIGPDGLLYQTTVISNAPAVIQTAPPQVQTNIHTM